MLVAATITTIAMAAQRFGTAVRDAAQDLDLSWAERTARDQFRPFRACNRAERQRRRLHELLVVVVVVFLVCFQNRVERASRVCRRDVRVNLSRPRMRMSEQDLNDAKVHPLLHEMGRE